MLTYHTERKKHNWLRKQMKMYKNVSLRGRNRLNIMKCWCDSEFFSMLYTVYLEDMHPILVSKIIWLIWNYVFVLVGKAQNLYITYKSLILSQIIVHKFIHSFFLINHSSFLRFTFTEFQPFSHWLSFINSCTDAFIHLFIHSFSLIYSLSHLFTTTEEQVIHSSFLLIFIHIYTNYVINYLLSFTHWLTIHSFLNLFSFVLSHLVDHSPMRLQVGKPTCIYTYKFFLTVTHLWICPFTYLIIFFFSFTCWLADLSVLHYQLKATISNLG